jgi:c-di-GMP-binding flagellar brake protein YcgR
MTMLTMSPTSDPSLQPVAVDSVDEDKYKVHSRLEISSVLGALQKAGSLVTCYFGEGSDFILTCIIRVDAEKGEVVLDYGADGATNLRALRSKGFTFVAAHERIKIQFSAETLRKTRFDNRDAFSIALPRTLLRLQRREYYRIVIPLSQPLKCAIPPQNDSPDAPEAAAVADISCGGVALVGFNGEAKIEDGMYLRGCQIQLADEGAVTADLLIRSTFEVVLKNGNKQLHAGCQFVNMPERVRANIQRYINSMERERRKRFGGR